MQQTSTRPGAFTSAHIRDGRPTERRCGRVRTQRSTLLPAPRSSRQMRTKSQLGHRQPEGIYAAV